MDMSDFDPKRYVRREKTQIAYWDIQKCTKEYHHIMYFKKPKRYWVCHNPNDEAVGIKLSGPYRKFAQAAAAYKMLVATSEPLHS